MAPRSRMFLGIALAALATVATAAWALLLRPPAPPSIQGVLLDNPRELPAFELVDQRGRAFDREDLRGRWHILSYGFTTCPDICPTTLTQLVAVAERLRERGLEPPRVLFYSIDHRRDTPEQLDAYLPFFDPAFLGLTHRDDPENPHLPFERSLGLSYQLTPLDGEGEQAGTGDYRVSHGVRLYVLNPGGGLQAVLKPNTVAAGQPGFDPDTVLRDYLAVRQYREDTAPR